MFSLRCTEAAGGSCVPKNNPSYFSVFILFSCFRRCYAFITVIGRSPNDEKEDPEMFFCRYNKGPRGRIFGHRGSPAVMILAIFGLIGFAPVALAVLFGLLVGAMGVVGGLIAAAGSILSSLPSAVFSGGGVILGIIIGLLLYYRNRTGKEAAADTQKKESTGTAVREETEYYPADHYRSYGA